MGSGICVQSAALVYRRAATHGATSEQRALQLKGAFFTVLSMPSVLARRQPPEKVVDPSTLPRMPPKTASGDVNGQYTSRKF